MIADSVYVYEEIRVIRKHKYVGKYRRPYISCFPPFHVSDWKDIKLHKIIIIKLFLKYIKCLTYMTFIYVTFICLYIRYIFYNTDSDYIYRLYKWLNVHICSIYV